MKYRLVMFESFEEMFAIHRGFGNPALTPEQYSASFDRTIAGGELVSMTPSSWGEDEENGGFVVTEWTLVIRETEEKPK